MNQIISVLSISESDLKEIGYLTKITYKIFFHIENKISKSDRPGCQKYTQQ